MANAMLTIAWDPSSLGAISRIPAFQSYLNTEMSNALLDIGDLLQTAMENMTWQVFMEPTGELADAITPYLTGPLTLEIDVQVPYAWRMERGFGPDGTAAADSLGRVYTFPGEPYAQPALDDNEDLILKMMNEAAGNAIADFKAGK